MYVCFSLYCFSHSLVLNAIFMRQLSMCCFCQTFLCVYILNSSCGQNDTSNILFLVVLDPQVHWWKNRNILAQHQYHTRSKMAPLHTTSSSSNVGSHHGIYAVNFDALSKYNSTPFKTAPVKLEIYYGTVLAASWWVLFLSFIQHHQMSDIDVFLSTWPIVLDIGFIALPDTAKHHQNPLK